MGDPSLFKGGVYVTRNGTSELFIQTVEERAAELRLVENEKQVLLNKLEFERKIHATVKLAMLSMQDIKAGMVFSAEEAANKLRMAREDDEPELP